MLTMPGGKHVILLIFLAAITLQTQGNVFTNPLFRWTRFDPLHNECGTNQEDREPCGRRHDAIGKAQCLSRGCCWDDADRVPAGTIRCFLAERMLSGECMVDYRDKDDCGYTGILEGECVTVRECCWKPSPRINDPDCFKPLKVTGLRLMNNGEEDEKQGRVEIRYEREWGTICDDSFGLEEAAVICKQLGYVAGTPKIEAYYGMGSGPILLDDLRCEGNETTITDCRHRGWKKHDCRHQEDAGVKCYEENEEIPDYYGYDDDYWDDYENRASMKPAKKSLHNKKQK